MPSPEEPPDVADLVRQAAAAADRAAQLRAITALTRVAAGPAAVTAFRLLARAPADGPRLALEFVARLPGKLPPDLVREVLPVLADRSAPVPVRVAAAAAVLATVPDQPRPVAAVVRAATAGLSRSRALERMYQLQSRV